MAMICENIICSEKYFFKNSYGELICRSKNLSEQLMAWCCDFDVVEENGCIHIAASDKEGNLVYIINNNGHWGRGIAAKGVKPENIFICCEGGEKLIYYVSDLKLYKICLDGDMAEPTLIDEILYYSMPFVCGNKVYYINKKEKLCRSDGEEICGGGNISHIFATNKYLCVKDDDRLDLISTEDFSDKKSLTRRHGRSAQCPLYVCTGDVETLCWHDENEVFFSRKKNGKWCGLETITVQNAERLGIYKFDGKYDLGCLKNGQICSCNARAFKNK